MTSNSSSLVNGLGDLPHLLKRRAAPYPINGAEEAAALMTSLF